MPFLNKFGGGSSRSFGFSKGRRVTPTIEYLVIAGGGAAHPDGEVGSGGGAGGYRTNVTGQTSGRNSAAESSFAVAAGVAYTVTVGAGGSASNGSNSVFSTITSLGGGGQVFNASGGSGSGGSYQGGSGAGTANQGGDGNAGINNYPYSLTGGGGGGAGVTTGGGGSQHGRSGLYSDITGTSVARAGGGGGATLFAGGASGGLGGGGFGGERAAGGAGSTNTGSGGGAGGGAGGSGIVIIRYADSFDNIPNIGAGLTYSLSTTGGYKIYSFTAGTGTVTF
jgi:hypothetical protein